jgi:hypothetical protein
LPLPIKFGKFRDLREPTLMVYVRELTLLTNLESDRKTLFKITFANIEYNQLAHNGLGLGIRNLKLIH